MDVWTDLTGWTDKIFAFVFKLNYVSFRIVAVIVGICAKKIENIYNKNYNIKQYLKIALFSN